VEGLPEPDVKVYLHACLLAMEGMRELDLNRFLTDNLRRAALPCEKDGERRAESGFLWPQKNCHRCSNTNVEGRARSPFAPPSDEAPSSRRIGAQRPYSFVHAHPVDPSPIRWFIASLHSLLRGMLVAGRSATVRAPKRRGGPQITPLAEKKEAEAATASFFFWLYRGSDAS
jgi:hypothetical protein